MRNFSNLLALLSKVIVVHHIVAKENFVLGHAKLREVVPVSVPSDNRRRAHSHIALFDPFLPIGAWLVVARTFRHDDCRDPIRYAPMKSGKSMPGRPAWN